MAWLNQQKGVPLLTAFLHVDPQYTNARTVCFRSAQCLLGVGVVSSCVLVAHSCHNKHLHIRVKCITNKVLIIDSLSNKRLLRFFTIHLLIKLFLNTRSVTSRPVPMPTLAPAIDSTWFPSPKWMRR